MQYSQKIPFGYTRTHFNFTEDHLDYMVKGETFDYGFCLPYENISADSQIKTVVEKWPRYVVLTLWLACVIEFLMDKSIHDFNIQSPAVILFWGLFLVCLVIIGAQKYFMRNDTTSLKTILGNIIVLDNANHKAILAEIELRRKAAIKKKYADINPLNNPAAELAKLRNFKENGILSDAEYAAIASQLSMTK